MEKCRESRHFRIIYKPGFILDLLKREMKLPKTIDGLKLVKVLVKKGYAIKGRSGSHISLSNGTIHITIVMPVTTIGVYKKICKITGISVEEFL